MDLTNLELAEKLETAVAENSPVQYGLLRVIHEVAQELRRAVEPTPRHPVTGEPLTQGAAQYLSKCYEETCPRCGEFNVSPYVCKVHGDNRTVVNRRAE
jgi:hypothetical protein